MTNEIIKDVQNLRKYLETNGIITKNGDNYHYKNYYFCHIQEWDDNGHVIFWGDKDRQGDLEEIITDDEMKAFMHANVKVCNGECGCKEWPRGGSLTLFGKTYDSVCSSYYIFMNPDAVALANIKKLVDLTKIAADKYFERKAEWLKAQTDRDKINYNELISALPKDIAVDIDLASMETKATCQAELTNGTLILTNTESERSRAQTKQSFNAPLKIDLRVKISDTHLEILFGNGLIKFFQENGRNELQIKDIDTKERRVLADMGGLPVGEFVDIEWICAKTFMAVRVNGDERLYSMTDDYIHSFDYNHEFAISSPISICCYRNSTVTIESLRVTVL